MRHIVELDRSDVLCAIENYLLTKGYKHAKSSYYPWVTFTIGDINIGTQREPETVETIVGAKCLVEV